MLRGRSLCPRDGAAIRRADYSNERRFPVLAIRLLGRPFGLLSRGHGELKRDLEMRLNDAFAREFADLTVQRVAEIGDPAETITTYAHTQGADRIMMPTSSRHARF